MKTIFKITIIFFVLTLIVCCTKKESSESTNTFTIGQNYGGGIIFYIDGTGQHGLIAATSDQVNSAWGNPTITISGTSSDLGTGQANTNAIITAHGVSSYAANVCNQLVLGGYSDWFLPSKDELSYLYNQKGLVGGFGSVYTYYWSSTEAATNAAWIQRFDNGAQLNYLKSGTSCSTRAIRAF